MGHRVDACDISPAEERQDRIIGAAELLHQHLLQDPPLVLPADVRWCIAEEARHCWTRCKVCSCAATAKCPEAVQALGEGLMEISMVYQDPATGIWVKSRPDNIPHNGYDFSDIVMSHIEVCLN